MVRFPRRGRTHKEVRIMLRHMRFAVLGAGLAAAGLVLAPGTSVMANSAGPVQCQIQVSRVAGGVVLRSIASARIAARGNYSLAVNKDGDAGSSDISQDGGFSLAPGGASTLSEVNLSLERGASYEAVLTLTWAGGSVSCHKALPSAI